MGQLGRWKHWAVFLLIAPAASLAAYHLGSLAAVGLKQQEQRAALPAVNGLYIEPQTLDMGEVWETPRHTFRLTIRNVGRSARTISRFQTTCGCLVLDPLGQTIAPGDKAEFTCNLDLMRRLSYQSGIAQWPVSVRLDPVFEGNPAPTHGWEVKGIVRGRVSIDNPRLAFEDSCSHEGPRVWRKIRIKPNVPLESLQASVDPKFAEARVERSANPEDYFLFVSPNPTLPIGRFRFEVELQVVMLDGAVHPCPSIEVTGEMQPSSRVIPRMVLLGEHTVPSEAEADVTLRLPANDWKIDHIETDTTEILVKQSKSELEEGVRLHITQRIGQAGDQVSIIRIVVRKPDKQTEIVPLEVRYYGQSSHGNASR